MHRRHPLFLYATLSIKNGRCIYTPAKSLILHGVPCGIALFTILAERLPQRKKAGTSHHAAWGMRPLKQQSKYFICFASARMNHTADSSRDKCLPFWLAWHQRNRVDFSDGRDNRRGCVPQENCRSPNLLWPRAGAYVVQPPVPNMQLTVPPIFWDPAFEASSLLFIFYLFVFYYKTTINTIFFMQKTCKVTWTFSQYIV